MFYFSKFHFSKLALLLPSIAGLFLLLAMFPVAFAGEEETATLDAPVVDSPSAEEESDRKDGIKEEQSIFLRVRNDDDGEPVAMETSIVSYMLNEPGEEPLVVDLIGAVHIGDKSYYEALNDEFEKYDALLYELVAEEGTRPESEARSTSILAAFQSGMGNVLELDYQLECVDYSCDNFVHADMSPEDFAEAMKDRGEGWMQMYFRSVGQSMAAQSGGGGTSDVDLLMALFAPDRAVRLKRIMAAQFSDLDGAMSSLDGPDGSAILTDRNTRALEVLAEQIEAGQKRIGIFYGAAHLPDLEERLATEFDLHRTEEKWLVAWDLTGDE